MNPVKNLIKFILRPFNFQKLKLLSKNKLVLIATGGFVGFSSFHYQKNMPHLLKYKNETFPVDNKPLESSSNKNFVVKIARNCTPSIVLVRVQDKAKIDKETGKPLEVCKGSGFVVKSNGWILTNAHNIMLKKKYAVEVITEDGILCQASVVDVDLLKDLALLKIDYNNLKPLRFGNSEELIAGEWVVALGNHETLSNRVTAGVVSSVNRDSKELGLKSVSLNYIQTDAAITYDHAGGPLVNLKSEVIGVNNLRVTPGISFALPADYVKEFLMKNAIKIDRESDNDEHHYSSMKNTCCGITTVPVTISKFNSVIASSNPKDISEYCLGVLVWNVVENSPAHKAGILPGDLITHIDDRPVRTIADLYVRLFWESEDNPSLTLHRRGAQNSHIKNFVAKIAQNCTPSIVLVRVQDKAKICKETGQPVVISKGFGFMVKLNGWVLTNSHYITFNKKKLDIEIITKNGFLYPASVVIVDLLKDLALLKIDYNNAKPLNSDDLKDLIALRNLEKCISFNYKQPHPGRQLVSDYVKISLMKNVVKINRKRKKNKRYSSIQNIGSEIKMSEMNSGVLVWNIVQNSPAHKAGILPGDLITHIDDKPVRTIADLYVRLFWESEDDANLTLHRRGSKNSAILKF